MQEKQQLFLLEDCNCKCGNTSKQVCINQQCHQMAFLCSKQSCSCRLSHKNCKCIDIMILYSNLQSKHKGVSQVCQGAINKVLDIYDKIIISFSQLRENFIQSTMLAGLKHHSRQLVNSVNDRTIENITGQKIALILQQLKSEAMIALFSQDHIQKIWKITQGNNTFEFLKEKVALLHSDQVYQLLHYAQSWGKCIADGFNRITFDQWLKSGKTLYQIADLDLRKKKIVQIPKSISLLVKLRNLDLRQNKIKNFQPLATLENLTFLNFSSNHLESMKGISNLKKLRKLQIYTQTYFDEPISYPNVNPNVVQQLSKVDRRYTHIFYNKSQWTNTDGFFSDYD